MIQPNTRDSIVRLGRDGRFYAALSVGAVFWLLLWGITRPALDLAWPLRQPIVFLLPVVVYPVFEELVFRGVLQGRLLRPRLGHIQYFGVTAANAVASVIFAAVHLINQPPLWAISVFFPSLIFGYFYDRYTSVLPGIILHIFYNAGFFWFFMHT